MAMADALVVHGMIDGQGRLIAGDPRLQSLQRAAGGEAGGPVAVPPLASVARLARTLGIPVSRGIVVGEGQADLDLWVRAQPEGDAVRIAITGWQLRDPPPVSGLEREIGFARLEQDGEWACDSHLKFTMIDAALGDLLGTSRGQGEAFTRLFRLIEDDAGDIPLIEALASRAAFAGQCVELRTATGADGQFAGYVGGFRWDAEYRPVQPKRGAGVAATDQDAFAARLDNALRQPLNRIIRNADAIGSRSEGALRQDYAAYAGDISAASRHLLGLVDDLGDLQAVEQIGFTTEAEAIDLCDIARRGSNLLSVRAADRQVRLDPPAAGETLMAVGDFRRTLQILVNLISNAVRYSPPGSSIWVRLEEEDDLAAVIVADQGAGIAMGDQARIFEKFERVDPSEPGGSGLGLYISRRLARAMGGDITVDSAPGQGARFALTLPRAAD
jgi:signal transduction histidine kinase